MKQKVLIGMITCLLMVGLLCACTPAKIRLNKTKVTIKVGQTYKLKVKGTKKKVKWTSSKKSVVSVSKKGKIKGKKKGKATITARVGKKKLKCKVKVVVKANTSTSDSKTSEEKMIMEIDGKTVPVAWNDNESVKALRNMVKDKPLEIKMSRYGGFEQVGSIGKTLPSNDKETTTSPGDIVLYSSDQIVVFYGSNEWDYTRLGKINLSKNEIKTLLDKKNVTIKIHF